MLAAFNPQRAGHEQFSSFIFILHMVSLILHIALLIIFPSVRNNAYFVILSPSNVMVVETVGNSSPRLLV